MRREEILEEQSRKGGVVMAIFPTIKEMSEEVATRVLDEYIYKGKTLREWIEALVQSEKALEAEPCADAISRQAVWVKITSGAYPGESTEQFIDRISKEVDTMPSVTPKQKWIPVSEELPEQGQEVICQCRANMIKVLKLDADFDWYQDADHCYMNGFVIAWMPLPEPYKAESEEEE